MLSSERARTIQIILAVLGFGLGGLTRAEAVVTSGYLPELLGGLVGLIVLGLIVFRRLAFNRANQEAGNRALAIQLLERAESMEELPPEQARFVKRLLQPWYRSGYWLLVGGRELEQPGRGDRTRR